MTQDLKKSVMSSRARYRRAVGAEAAFAGFDLHSFMDKLVQRCAFQVFHKEDQREKEECWVVYNNGRIWHFSDRGPSGKEEFRHGREVRAPESQAIWAHEAFPLQQRWGNVYEGYLYTDSLASAEYFVAMMLEGRKEHADVA